MKKETLDKMVIEVMEHYNMTKYQVGQLGFNEFLDKHKAIGGNKGA